jgi:hypothetical protein
VNREPTVEEIAALTARPRELSNAGAAEDEAERAKFLGDKDALIERIIARTPRHAIWSGDEWADYRTYTRAEAVDELVARGVPPEQAPAVVERYLDGLSWERGWSPQDQWEIDDDLAVMITPPVTGNDASAHLGLTGAEGPAIDAGPALTAEEAAHELATDGRDLDDARALVRGYLDDVSAQVGTRVDLWGLDAADLDAIRTSPGRDDPEAERRAQLARWHTDDEARESVDEHVLEDSP